MKTLEPILIFFNLLWLPIFLSRKEGDWTAKWVGGFVCFIWIPLAIIAWLITY